MDAADSRHGVTLTLDAAPASVVAPHAVVAWRRYRDTAGAGHVPAPRYGSLAVTLAVVNVANFKNLNILFVPRTAADHYEYYARSQPLPA